MEPEPRPSLEKRIARLEKAVERIERALEIGKESDEQAAEKKRLAALRELESLTRKKRTGWLRTWSSRVAESLRNTEGWIARIGIGLLLFGLVFLFKYAVDQGWLTPPVRVLFGLFLGFLLIGLAALLYAKRRSFSLLLLGGGIVAFYATAFAAFQVFELVSFKTAFVFLVSVALLSFALSVRQSEATPALLGIVGGLLTPFLLYVEPGSLPGLVAYTCILITGSLLVYYVRAWRPLFWLTFLGGGAVLGFALGTGFAFTNEPLPTDRIPMQAGLVYAWIVFSILPIVREVRANRAGSSLVPTLPGLTRIETDGRLRRYLSQHLQVIVPIMAVAMFLSSTPIWTLSEEEWGLVAFVGSLIYGTAAFALNVRPSLKEYAVAHGIAAVLLLTAAIILIYEGHLVMLLVVGEATVLHAFGRRYGKGVLHIGGYILFGIIAFVMLDRLTQTDFRSHDFRNPRAVADLIAFGLALFSSFKLSDFRVRRLYRATVYVAFLALIIRELDQNYNGQAQITMLWGLCGVVMVVWGLRVSDSFIRALGVGTLLVIVGKLFLVDLAALKMTWRILLFLGFGGVFLILSYFFRSIGKKTAGHPDSRRPAGVDNNSPAADNGPKAIPPDDRDPETNPTGPSTQ